MKRVNFVSLDFLTLQWFCNTLQTQHPQTQAAKELDDALEMDPVQIFPINGDKENAVISRLFSMFSINLVQAKSSKNKGF